MCAHHGFGAPEHGGECAVSGGARGWRVCGVDGCGVCGAAADSGEIDAFGCGGVCRADGRDVGGCCEGACGEEDGAFAV